MLNPNQTALPQAVEMLGELHPLLAQLGSADGLVTLSTVAASLRLPRVDSRSALTVFLEGYRKEMLGPLELPAICRAWHHASRHEVRELIALDHAVACQARWPEFAAASQRVGRGHLEKLRPLRDDRVVQRYLQAVRDHRAHGWHTLVFGLTLALYSLPVRQGLMTYARQTVRGFIHAAARPLRLTKTECLDLLENLCAELPKLLETIVAAETDSPPGFPAQV